MWKKLDKTKVPLNIKIKVKRSVKKGVIEYEGIGIAKKGKVIVQRCKGFNCLIPTHWDYFEK